MHPLERDEEGTMKYLCLVCIEEKKLDALSGMEFDALNREALAYEEELRRSGHFVVAQTLEPVQTATTVRIRNGRVSTTDGPFAETPEQVGGFFLVDAKDLNEAIRVASKIPSARLGCVEVRPVRELGQR
jgi:hypothetical protein